MVKSIKLTTASCLLEEFLVCKQKVRRDKSIEKLRVYFDIGELCWTTFNANSFKQKISPCYEASAKCNSTDTYNYRPTNVEIGAFFNNVKRQILYSIYFIAPELWNEKFY